MTALPNDAQRMMLYDAGKKSVGIAYLFWFFLCFVGAHRFYLGKTGSAVAMLVLTLASFVLMIVGVGFLIFGAVGIWALVDAFLIPGMVQEHNVRLVAQLGN